VLLIRLNLDPRGLFPRLLNDTVSTAVVLNRCSEFYTVLSHTFLCIWNTAAFNIEADVSLFLRYGAASLGN
jgi:hypothetical protein